MECQGVRCEYKKVWSALSITEDHAKLHVIGVTGRLESVRNVRTDDDWVRALGTKPQVLPT
jgi:hypothetical protein